MLFQQHKIKFQHLYNVDVNKTALLQGNELANDLVTNDLEALIENKFLKSTSIIAVERASKGKPFLWPTGLSELKVRKYGHAVICYGIPSQNG
jgi:hypothetical protein